MICFTVPVSYYLERTRGATFLDYLPSFPLVCPPLPRHRPDSCLEPGGLDRIYESSAILIIAFVSAYSPFVIKVISAKIRQINPEFEESVFSEPEVV
ncbi:hypothetical protein QUF72_21895 [Desulfobacterales bacterium HSG2]|nr:hypothetical protein [Desulfobacterales bacterium HSG2]